MKINIDGSIECTPHEYAELLKLKANKMQYSESDIIKSLIKEEKPTGITHYKKDRNERLSEPEKRYIIQNSKNLNMADIAKNLGRPYSTVANYLYNLKKKKPLITLEKHKARRHTIWKANSYKRWTMPEIAYVKANKGKMTARQIGKQLNRSTGAIKSCINNLDK